MAKSSHPVVCRLASAAHSIGCVARSEITVELTIFLTTAALVLVTWLLYKLAAWLEPRS